MPLTNEGPLRTALDALFYKDTILSRLITIGHEKIMEHLPMRGGESVGVYLDRVCAWISAHFVGYSISHVSGRFRAGPLSTMEEVANFQQHGERYLIDETTAVVRFIFPCGQPSQRKTPISAERSDDAIPSDAPPSEPEDAKALRWFFWDAVKPL